MIQHDDAIGDIFFQSVPGQRPITPFPGDDCRDALPLEPAEQPPQFGAQDGRVGEAGEEGFNRVQHDPLGPDRVDGMPQAHEQTLQVILARLLDLAPLDVDVIHRELLLTHQFVQVEAQRADVLRKFFGCLLEGHQHAGLVELRCSANQEFDAEHSFATTGTSAHQGGPPAGEPSAREFVKPLNSRGSLGETARSRIALGSWYGHRTLPRELTE